MRLALPLLLAAQLLLSCQPQPAAQESTEPTAGSDSLYVSPSGQSDERAYELLPRTGSEDAHALLQLPTATSRPAAANSETSYFAHERFDWVIQLKPSQALSRQQVAQAFDADWRKQHGQPEVYGRAVRTGKWTFLLAGDGDSVFSEVAFGWRLFNARSPTPRSFTAPELQAFAQSVAAKTPVMGARVTRISLPPVQAAARAQALSSFVSTNNQEALIVLQAPAGRSFEGLAIWDAMRSLGLHWGDMDLFHWENVPDGLGDDHLFSVSTSTEPGYFLPEHLAKGEVQTTNLVFSFSIPRTADPAQVLVNMHRAASYCQRKLGGQLLTADHQPFSLATETQKCRRIEQNLRAQQFQPGQGETLYLF
jgi:cell division protein ZipA